MPISKSRCFKVQGFAEVVVVPLSLGVEDIALVGVGVIVCVCCEHPENNKLARLPPIMTIQLSKRGKIFFQLNANFMCKNLLTISAK
jgi:hypothetical protein